MDKLSGWSGYWTNFLKLDKIFFINKLIQYVDNLEWTESISDAQKNAWSIEYDVMRTTLEYVISQTESKYGDKSWISFEHELVGESGKRVADVNLVLSSGELFVLEFKHKEEASNQEITRAAFDLKTMINFHSESTSLTGKAYLCLTKKDATPFIDDYVKCDIATNNLLPTLADDLITSLQKDEIYEVKNWQRGTYIRQHGILSGTVDIFFNKRMPNLKNDAAENINQARQALFDLYRHAKEKNKKYVVLVDGNPGAGKTLLGISVACELTRSYQNDQLAPLFLSGNDALVQVLRYTLEYYDSSSAKTTDLDARSLIKELKSFKKVYANNSYVNNISENYIIFDEAQRAWEKSKVRGFANESDLHVLCSWLSGKAYGVLVLLVGNGQAIHNNEMSETDFLIQLEKAVNKYGSDFSVISSSKIYEKMPVSFQNRIIKRDVFFLRTAIRQHYVDDLPLWIDAVLSGNYIEANKTIDSLHPYPLFITKSKKDAEQYAISLKNELNELNINVTKFRMGWLQSSKGQEFLPSVNIPSMVEVGPWYVNHRENDIDLSCCKFDKACNEFSSQGLEISLTLLNWGNDLVYRSGKLESNINKRTQEQYTFGSYRVLLSRGKNGLIIKVDDPETYQYLKQCGMKELIT